MSKDRLYRRRFLVPNAVTLGGMFCGFLACIYAASGRFEKAAIAIFIAILLDGLDGRVARKLNATSKFGLEFDSLSDLVSFGVAPAFLIYHWAFLPLADEFGVFICFIYTICAASRLARFNISEPSWSVIVLSALLLPALGYMMVSKIEFFSIKVLTLRSIGFPARVALGGLIALIWYSNKVGLLVLTFVYCASGPIKSLRARRQRTEERASLAA
ncbi:MAG: CDP-diacylglycerol--serine O-phosphatidyltransferase [Proteobacteria bacterium]|nr:MAG: CDP-diacylglycerol--serine O-phosphatidyltransferase [Pseudomonadota bacterium]